MLFLLNNALLSAPPPPGINPKVQSKWSVAATIYSSLKASGTLQPSVLAHFDNEVGDDFLYPFR